MGTLVDSNILIDIATDDSAFGERSEDAINDAGMSGDLVVNQIIVAEICRSFPTDDTLNTALEILGVVRESLPFDAGRPAAEAFAKFIKKRGRARGLVLPDFLIGAHAQYARHDLLTRDPKRFRTYFPDVQLITP